MPGNETPLSDGSYVQVSETSDQQHVFVDHYSSAGVLLNEQRWDGMAYDLPTITATTDAGYVIDLPNQEHATTITIEKVTSDGTVYTTPSLGAPLTAQLTSAVTATAGGGFVVAANEPGSPGKEASFEDFSTTGQLLHGASIDGYDLTATAEQGGGYVLSWDSFTGGTRSLTVDATHAPDLTAPPAPDIVGYDHTTGQTFQSGAETSDPHPTIELRVTSDEVGDTITNGPGGFSHLITQADLSQGTVVLPEATPGNDTYRLDKPDGVDASTTFTYFYSGSSSPPPPPPPPPGGDQTLQAQDGGSDLVGGSGDDTLIGAHGPDTMTGNAGADHFVFNEVPWQGAQITDFTPGTDLLDVSALLQQAGYTGPDPVGAGYVKFLDDGHGDTWLYFDPTPSTNPWGDYIATIQGVAPSQLGDGSLVGGSGAVSPPPVSPPPVSPPPVSPPPASGGQTLQAQDGGSNLQGGAGDDTLIGAHGPDTMTGAGGADHFVFNEAPWQGAQITDFTPGTDLLDVSALLQQAGYSGSDPVGDGYVKFLDDGHGDTWLYFDPTPSTNQWGDYVATLQGVAPSQLSDASLVSGSATASPPPVSPPPASGGQTLQAQDGGSNLVGGSGDDTLIGAHGPDTMTGNAGADHFVFNEVPWQGAQITDFTSGTDKIDLSALLHQAGYSGSDPVADGYVKFLDDGHGDTWLYYDPMPSSDPWGDYVATIQHVTPSQLGVGDIIWH